MKLSKLSPSFEIRDSCWRKRKAEEALLASNIKCRNKMQQEVDDKVGTVMSEYKSFLHTTAMTPIYARTQIEHKCTCGNWYQFATVLMYNFHSLPPLNRFKLTPPTVCSKRNMLHHAYKMNGIGGPRYVDISIILNVCLP